MKKINALIENLQDSNAIPAIIFVTALILHSQAFCDTAAEEAVMTGAVATATKIIFSEWAKKIVLAAGAFYGGIKTVGAGSVYPFVTWFGCGLIYNFLPSMINLLVSMGK
jgi:hypothetical protein